MLDLINTGSTPIFETAISNFNRNVLPAIAEKQGAFGGSITGSGFQNLAGREASNLLDEAARTNVELQANAVPLLGSLAGSQASLLSSLLGT